MADSAVDTHPAGSAENEDAWVASLLFDRDPSAAPTTTAAANNEHSTPSPDGPAKAADPGDLTGELCRSAQDPGQHCDSGDFEKDEDEEDPLPVPVNLDTTPPSNANPDVAAGADDAHDANAGAKKTALVLGAGLLVAVAGIFGALTLFSRPEAPAAPHRPQPSIAAQVSAAPAPAPVPPDQDQAVPFTASANCPAGSTSAQTLTDTASDSAWVCVRGAPGGQVDGQVLHIDLGRSYLLTAVSVTPGWVAKTPGGKDEWLAHRVVTRLQYIFNDDDRTIFTHDTANTHGPVITPLPKKVLASRVTVIILQTSRPPASPLPSTDPSAAAQPGFLDSVLGAGNGPAAPEATATSQPDPLSPTSSDPVDATFAVAEMKFFGHQPN